MRYKWRQGNSLQLLENGDSFFPQVFKRISQACREVLIQTFILYEDRVGLALRDALIAAAKRGVQVEITVDGFGSPDLSGDFVEGLLNAGVGLHMVDPKARVLGQRVNPFRRLHTKIVVVDGCYAFLGGINFCAEHLVHDQLGGVAMQDYAIEIQGPVVHDIRAFTLDTLAPLPGSVDLQLAPTGAATALAGQVDARLVIRDNKRHKTDIEKQYRHGIRAARHRVVLANAYFFPGYRLLRDIRNAARRGVQVHLILQGRPDIPIARLGARLLYAHLMSSGVQIHEYHRRSLHAKIALADSDWATVGSSNLDPSSLALNVESNLFIRSADFNGQLYEVLERLILEDCHTLSLDHLRKANFLLAPLIFLIFHFLRRFPAWAQRLPNHSPRLVSLKSRGESVLERAKQDDNRPS